MLSVRNKGQSVPNLAGKYLGRGRKTLHEHLCNCIASAGGRGVCVCSSKPARPPDWC
ncbi:MULTISPECIES: hypothetical protein [unclassified Pseudovibrio]|uniref:hypothetical protein n=1 Tax=unclassified Pseudovibrio TaxID=2627060 RepID=UPI001FCB6A32|nr:MULTISPECIES: hypothetical protein [unclassified Pseudovibrio]